MPRWAAFGLAGPRLLVFRPSAEGVSRPRLVSSGSLSAENAIFRQQLAVLQRGRPRPLLRPADRVLWMIPDGADDATVRARLLQDYRIEIAGGFGPLKGKGWRIGGWAAAPASERALPACDAGGDSGSISTRRSSAETCVLSSEPCTNATPRRNLRALRLLPYLSQHDGHDEQ